ncbi:MAG: hypothetical protein ACOYLS_13015 [Polymorphobacter sp.]
MTRVFAAATLIALTGCATDHYAGNQICARTAGCVSSFDNTGYGPVHAQAVAPDSPGPLQPQK